LVKHCKRHEKLQELYNKCLELRPNVDWEAFGDIVSLILSSKSSAQKGPIPLTPEELAKQLVYYRRWIEEEYGLVLLEGFQPLRVSVDGQRFTPRLSLDNNYIRLKAIHWETQREIERAERQEIEHRAKEDARESSNHEFSLSSHDRHLLIKNLGEHLSTRRSVNQERVKESVDLEVAFRESGQMVVIGPPGAGKSTFLRFLARRVAADPKQPIPIFIALGHYAARLTQEGNVKLAQFFLEGIHDSQWRVALKQAIEEGQVLWLLDGLDEVRERGARANVLANLNGLHGQMVLTSRPLGYDRGMLPGLPHFELLPLTTGDIDTFLDNWYSALPELPGLSSKRASAWAAATKERLVSQPNLKPLLNNPLMLSFLAVLAGEDPTKELPRHRAGIYKRYLDELLTSWEVVHQRETDGHKLTIGPLRGEPAHHALREGLLGLGWWLHLTYYGGYADQPPLNVEAIEVLTTYFKGSSTFEGLARHEVKKVALDVLDFWHDAGILETWHLHDNVGAIYYLAFRHLTFEEYAVAVGLARQWRRDEASAWAFLQPRLHHRDWLEPIQLLVTILSMEDEDAATRLVRRIWKARSPYERDLRRDLFLAWQCIANAVDIEPSTRRDILNEILSLYLDGSVTQLSWYSTYWNTSLLSRDLLYDQAQRLLSVSSEKDCILIEEHLLAIASVGRRSRWHIIKHNPMNDILRKSATKALSELCIQTPRVRNKLLSLLQDSTVGAEAVETLGIIGSGTEEEINKLIQLLHDRTNEFDNRKVIGKSLGLLVQRKPQLLTRLISAIEDTATRPYARIHLIAAVFKAAETIPDALDYILVCYSKLNTDFGAADEDGTADGLHAGERLFEHLTLPIIERHLEFLKGSRLELFKPQYHLTKQVLGMNAAAVTYKVREAGGDFVLRTIDLTNEFIQVLQSQPNRFSWDLAFGGIMDPLVGSALRDHAKAEELIRRVLRMDRWILAEWIESLDNFVFLESEDLPTVLEVKRHVSKLRDPEEPVWSSEISAIADFFLGITFPAGRGRGFDVERSIQIQKGVILGRLYGRANHIYFMAADLEWDLLHQLNPVALAALACFRQWDKDQFELFELVDSLSTEEIKNQIARETRQALAVLESDHQGAFNVLEYLVTQRPFQIGDGRDRQVAAAHGMAQFATDYPASQHMLHELLYYAVNIKYSSLDRLISALGLVRNCNADSMRLLFGYLRDVDSHIQYVASRTLSVLDEPSPEAISFLVLSYDDLAEGERLIALKILGTAEQTTDELLNLLTGLLDSRDVQERSAAAEALANLNEGYRVLDRLITIADNTAGAVSALVSAAKELHETEQKDKVIQLRKIATTLHRTLRASVYPYFRVARSTGEISYDPFEAFSRVANLLTDAVLNCV
jgi:energy-coupling factor transporter ATP-binding protein EcfA2